MNRATSVNLTNAATGTTSGGLLVQQWSVGGDGGNAATGGATGSVGGAGGNATSTLNVSDGLASSIDASTSATGGNGGTGDARGGNGGAATATVNVTTTKKNVGVDAEASATSGASGGARGATFGATGGPATATATTTGAAASFTQAISYTSSSLGEVQMLAKSAVEGGPASATTTASIGTGAAPLIAIKTGQSAANAVLLPNGGGNTIGLGSASIGSGGPAGLGINYSAQTAFGYFQPLAPTGDFKIDFLSSNSTGLHQGQSILSLEVDIYSSIGESIYSYTFGTLAQANAFFNNNIVDYGVVKGLDAVSIDYSMESFIAGDGFGFNYGLVYTPGPAPGRGVLALAALVLAGGAARVLRNRPARG